MSNRLDTIYNLIDFKSMGVADVGTDHGLIPVRLLKNGYIGSVVASDINELPLQKAIQFAIEEGLENCIQFVLCDGLSMIDQDSVDTIVIAGMGGETITRILDEDYWCAHPKYTLILQPMTQQHILRFWLTNNDFCIQQELLVQDEDKIYNVLKVRFGESPKYSDAELYTGKFEKMKALDLFPEYLDHLIDRFSNIVRGLQKSANSNLELAFNRKILEELLTMKERMCNESK